MLEALNDCLKTLERIGLALPCDDDDNDDDSSSDGLEVWASDLLGRLSSHTCASAGLVLCGASVRSIRAIRDDAHGAALSVECGRADALRHFWDERMLNNGAAVHGACTVDTVRITDLVESEESGEGAENDDDDDEQEMGSNEIHSMTAIEFKRRYVHRNIPCLVRGLDRAGFRRVTNLWRKERVNQSKGCRHECHGVNDGWFLEHVGEETSVPVQVSGAPKEGGGLDNEGRATECDTAEIPLRCWIDICRGKDGTAPDPSMYLKDWHLVQYLAGAVGEGGAESETWASESAGYQSTEDDELLYSVPSIFAVDFLNRFLLRYVGGDYRFVYWGPAGSTTALHSDVLHTFSWSYNVVGEKLWTFYPPAPTPAMDHEEAIAPPHPKSRTSSFVLIQRGGETVFVPSGWKHEVTNRIETLSINHNWVTAASVDRLWDCVTIEMNAVEREADAWGVPSDDWKVREDMLRGCAGLNIASSFFMLLTSLVNQMDVLVRVGRSCNDVIGGKLGSVAIDKAMLWERFFDLFRLCHQLNGLIKTSEGGEFHLRERLHAAVKSESFVIKALLVASRITDAVVALRDC